MAHMGFTEVGADEIFPKVQNGFSFENYRRNEALLSDQKLNGKIPTARKTGTTIAGAVFPGGVVLGADTRSTSELIVEKNCQKIHYIAPNIYCCGAGTAADTEFTTAQISSELELLRLNSGVDSRVVTALTLLKRHLFNYQGNVSAALILGGVDATGGHLHTVYPHGSVDTLPFVTMGSGSLAAMSVFETEYKDNMTKEECMRLVEKAIRAGIFNDLGSGSNIDYCIITKGKVEMVRGCKLEPHQDAIARETVLANDVNLLKAKVKKPNYFASFPKGTTITVGEPIIENF